MVTFPSPPTKRHLKTLGFFWRNFDLVQFSLKQVGKFAPENGWLEYDRFLLGRLGLFSGAMAVSFRECNNLLPQHVMSWEE